VEMTCLWKARKTKGRFSSLPTVPWTTRTHRELPTFPPPRFIPDGKVENQTQVFHFPTVTRDDGPCLYRLELRIKKEVGRFAASAWKQQHSRTRKAKANLGPN
jgi:hypothetical protein